MGYHPRPQSTMVATKVLISLCVYGLTAAAPQLGQNLNQEVIVNDVVTALQPSIAEAVANALRGLSTTVTSFNSAGASGAGFSGSSSSANSGFSSTGFSSNSGSSTGFSGNSGSSSGFSSNSGFAAGGSSSGSVGVGGGAAVEVEDALTRPEYNFQFNVADDESQTYITQQENRDGDAVTGTYSYVDPSGALVTVNYEAGPMGYAQTVEKKEGFVTISESNKAKINNAQVASNGGSAVTGNGFSGGNSFRPSSQGGQVSTVTSSAIDESALIAQIMAVLQPQISSAVNSAVSQQQSTTTTFGNSFRGNSAQTGNSFQGNSANRVQSAQTVAGNSFRGSSATRGQSAFQRGQQVATVNVNSANSESALIAQILAVLQPQISSAVNTAVRQQQSTTTSRVQSAQTGFSSANRQTGFSSANRQTGFRATSQRVSGDRLTPLFGN